MVEIKNVKVYGLTESIKRSGYAHIVGEPPDLYYTPKPENLDCEHSFSNPSFFDVLKPLVLTSCVSDTTKGLPTEQDNKRIKKLAKTPIGSGHAVSLVGIRVQFDLKYPQYYTPQFQRYHFAEIISSQSKMHSLLKVKNVYDLCSKYVDKDVAERVQFYIKQYGIVTTKEHKYHYFMKAISNLPMGFELWMGVDTSYLQLKTMYSQRKNHKLVEDWGAFTKWIEGLPMSHLITNKGGEI